MDTKDIIDYYDSFVIDQLESGINDRVYTLFEKLQRFGLKSDSNVLELGCGIGTMTFLLSRNVRKGKIEAVDISPESIRFAMNRIGKPNISFHTDDVICYIPSMQDIDYILLFDLIEHIPIERHFVLFQNLANSCSEHTKIMINIPNPEYINYDIENNPAALQIIDQPLPLKVILANIENAGLTLSFFETYSIWIENDYQFFVITKKKAFKETKLSDKRSFFQKVIMKMRRTFIKLKYNYH